jgi:hypothetical protein
MKRQSHRKDRNDTGAAVPINRPRRGSSSVMACSNQAACALAVASALQVTRH